MFRTPGSTAKVHNLTVASTDLCQDDLFLTGAIKHLRLQNGDQPTKFSYQCMTISICFIFYLDHSFCSHMQRGRSLTPESVHRRLRATVSGARHRYCYRLTRTPLTLAVVAQSPYIFMTTNIYMVVAIVSCACQLTLLCVLFCLLVLYINSTFILLQTGHLTLATSKVHVHSDMPSFPLSSSAVPSSIGAVSTKH